MQAIYDSYVVSLLRRLYAWFGSQWAASALVGWFTHQPEYFGRSWPRLRERYGQIFRTLRLDRLLEGSIFLRPGLFAAGGILLAPLLPTMAVLALVAASFFALLIRLGCDRDFRLVQSPLNRYMVLFAVCYAYGVVTSVTFRGSLLPGLLTIAFVLFFQVVISCGFDRRQLRLVLAGMVAAGVLVSCYGFFQKLFPSHFRNVWTDTDMFSSLTFRVYSTLENPNVLGEYFLLVIPLGAAMCLTAQRWRDRLLLGGASAVMAVCLVLTYSRGCYLGLLFAAALFLVLLDRRFLLVGILALLLSPLYLPETVLARFASIGNMGDTSTSYRVYIWLGTLAMLKNYWFSGIGPGVEAFNVVYPEYAYNAVTAPHSHNLYLQLICDLGIPGLVVFLLLLVSYYRMMFTAIRRETDRTARLLQIGAVSAVSGFLVESMTDYTFYNYRVLLLFWVVLALSVRFCRMGSPEEATDD